MNPRPGGPGCSSTNMEPGMLELHTKMDGTINVYTVDHRDTGRSNRLNCVAAQAMTTAPPLGTDIDPKEVPSCAKDLLFKYGYLSAFSITSAATDISTFISDYTNGANTFVYGVSYDTSWVERLMHLNTPSMNGYILDSVQASSGVPTDKSNYMSTTDRDYGEVGEYFMGLCDRDAECKAHFPSANLSSTVHNRDPSHL
ncbi:hypothetical protein PHYSODRAFT_254050 [Phytophthora sojae]|uniref:Uncharacterized protein n=1 Tax=Phytophthora sojae (strain P6497) TaxID=1094619 RepID=G5A8P8_PHYSP|nr:hypothetical protein PHYSODRAFT_254050 [Phytophthora sojae]EGZ08274.1 hypothetical protein PHYSODRAFT_254050 [Phytophthora sojae]|eukprot:XP_009536446.1 hypothetical protein PHYSODRAFT_254050 [Phytophthora sojae]